MEKYTDAIQEATFGNSLEMDPSLIKEWGVVIRFAILVLIFFYRLLQGTVGYLAEFLVILTSLWLYTLTDEFVSEINEMMVHTYSCSLKEVVLIY